MKSDTSYDGEDEMVHIKVRVLKLHREIQRKLLIQMVEVIRAEIRDLLDITDRTYKKFE